MINTVDLDLDRHMICVMRRDRVETEYVDAGLLVRQTLPVELRRQLEQIERAVGELARRVADRTPVMEAEPVDPPRVPAVARPPDIDALRDALINDMAAAAATRPDDVVRSLAQIAADATAATTIAELEECRRRAVEIIA